MNKRRESTTKTGYSFPYKMIQEVWQKAQTVPGMDTALYRKDACGALIKKNAYGLTAEFGWEIDHIKPVTQGGDDDLSNLQPLHWKNNRHKSDKYPGWSCAISAI